MRRYLPNISTAVLFLLPLPLLIWLSDTWYHGDDLTSIRPFITSWSDIFSRLFSKRVFIEFDTNFFRPLSLLLRAVAAKSGSPWLAHLINIALHYTTALLLFELFKYLKLRREYALTGALGFLLYSAAAPAVFWISGIGDLLTTLFAVLTIRMFLQYIDLGASRFINLPTIAVVYLLSLAGKEMSLTLPVTLALILILQKRKLREFTPVVLLSVVAGAFFLLRGYVLDDFMMGENNRIYFHSSALTYSINAFKYLLMIAVPAPPHLCNRNVLFIVSVFPGLILGILLIVKTSFRTTAIWAAIFLTAILPVCGVFSTWRSYYPAAIVITAITCGINSLKQHRMLLMFRVHLLISAFFFILVGFEFRNAGIFNRQLADSLAALHGEECLLLNIPTSYTSAPLLNADHTINEAIRLQSGRIVDFQLGFFKMVNRLPVEFKLRKISADKLFYSISADPGNYFFKNSECTRLILHNDQQKLQSIHATIKPGIAVYQFDELK